MDKENTWVIVLVIGLLVYGGYKYFSKNEVSQNNSMVQTTNITATQVQVSRFYDGEEGYSLAVPGGNTSTCNWTYVGGNGAIPDSETTFANNSSEKHLVHFGDYLDSYWDFKVNCTDDFGNQYVGVFPIKNE